jgi:hypothetical protein
VNGREGTKCYGILSLCQPRPRGWWLAAGFVILKCYVIARGDITTALGILQYVGLATVVTASLLSSLPILTAAMLASAVSQMTWSVVPKVVSESRIKKPKPPAFTWRLAAAMLGAFVLAAAFSPWTYLAIAALIGLAIGGTRALGTPKHIPRGTTLLLPALIKIVAGYRSRMRTLLPARPGPGR